ncbi:MAG: hypothetical protein ABI622_07680 [Chloroflexota bacterium]
MNDTTFGLLLLGIGIVFVLGLVFAVTSRAARASGVRPTPPAGVHLPPPSFLPALVPLAGILIFAGLAFRPDDQFANFFIFVPGLLLFVLSIIGWVRAANREWTDTEHGSHHDAPGH